MKIINVVGARPNFMKIAPIIEAIRAHNEGGVGGGGGGGGGARIESVLVHTGQHYDEKMSKLFFDELSIPRPDIDLGVGSGSQAFQTAEVIKRLEGVLVKEKPRAVLVVGDVNSTIAAALTASKLGVRIIHVEAGLRSFDRTMPEEINRVLTDAISDLLFTTERSANENLLKEGIAGDKIFFVGNVMIDTLLKNRARAQGSGILGLLGLKEGAPYAVLTLHRPSNVDEAGRLSEILAALSIVAGRVPIIFPAHPRTRKNLSDFGFMERFGSLREWGEGGKGGVRGKGIYLTDPLGYLDFLRLMSESAFVLTDSGGMQEETTILGKPCITLRENTERPVTITEGTNRLVGTDRDKIIKASEDALSGLFPRGRVPELWDGRAGERIVRIISERL